MNDFLLDLKHKHLPLKLYSNTIEYSENTFDVLTIII